MHYAKDLKTYFMTADYYNSMPDIESTEGPALLAEGEILVYDMNNITLKHTTHISFKALQTFEKYLLHTNPVALKGIHFVNCPPFMNKMLAIVKPFLSRQVFQIVSITAIVILFKKN